MNTHALSGEERLRECEERYRGIFENNRSVMLVIDPQSGAIIDANSAALSFYGWALEELLRKRISDINTMGPEALAAEMELALSESRNFFNFTHRLANGSIRNVEVYSGPFAIGGRKLLLSTVHDITERKRIDETLHFLSHSGYQNSGEDFFEALARFLAQCLEMDFVCIDRLQGDLLSARTVAIYHDGTFEDNVEYTLKDTPCGAVVEKHICCYQRDVRHLFQQDQVLQEMVAESYAGITLWSFDGKQIGLIAVIGRRPLDNPSLAESILKLVSVRAAAELERRQKDEELRILMQRLKLATDSAKIGIWDWDVRNDTWYASTMYFTMLGYDPDDSPADRNVWVERLHPDDRSSVMEKIRSVLDGDGDNYRYETRIRHADGDYRWINVIGKVAGTDEQGRVTRMLGVRQDITDRKNFERDLQQKNSELERFTYSVSHDLKSPLITIMTFAGYMLKDLESGRITHIEGDLKRVADAAARMSMLLDDLLELSRVGRTMNPPTKLDMGQLVNEVLTQLAGRINQHQVTVTVQPDLPALFGDSQRLAMVLQNLVENALKYRGDQPAPLIEIGSRMDSKQRVFFVRDNGTGIDPRDHEKIFELFTMLDSKSEGTGIGLSLVKRIIDVHGGKVWVESEGIGKGSTFCFTLPGAVRSEG